MNNKPPVIGENELKNIKKKLEEKTHVSTSEDGSISLVYTGDGRYKKAIINKELSELDKATFEKAIIDIIEYSKNQIQADFAEIMMNLSSSDLIDADEDSLDGDRRDVS